MKTSIYLTIITLFFSISQLQAQIISTDIEHSFSLTNNLVAPVKIALDQNDNIYITDVILKCIKKYNSDGVFLETFDSIGSPISLAINSLNEIYFGDKETGIINKISTDGTITQIYSSIVFPASMTFGSDNLLYIVDNKLMQVTVIDESGNFIRNIGNGTLVLPQGIAFDTKNNRILVTEHGGIGTGFNLNAKIWKFDLLGNLLGFFGSYGNAEGKFYRMQGIALNKCGNIFIPDLFQAEVSVFDENEIYLTKFGAYGSASGNLNLPLDIAIDSKERIIVVSTNNSSIEIYKIKNPTSEITTTDLSVCQGDSINISVDLTGESPWSFIYTKNDVDSVSIQNITESPYQFSVSDSGIYKIVELNNATYNSTCMNGISELTLYQNPVSDFLYSINGSDVSFTNNSLNSSSYFWDFGDGTTSQELSPTHTYQTSGNYNVTLTTSNSVCIDNIFSQTINITLVGINDVEKNNYFTMFPNPTNGLITIENIKSNSDYSIEIENITGECIYSKIITKDNQSLHLDLSKYSKGIYFIKIKSDKANNISKLVLSE